MDPPCQTSRHFPSSGLIHFGVKAVGVNLLGKIMGVIVWMGILHLLGFNSAEV